MKNMNAKNPWYPNYGAPQTLMPTNAVNQHVQGSPIWVNSEEDARNYPIARGNTLLLMDSQSNYFYLKTSDITGTNISLQKFAYEEVKEEPISEEKDDFKQLKFEFDEFRNEFKDFKETMEDLLK